MCSSDLEYPCLLSCPEEQLGQCRFLVGEFHGLAGSIAERQTTALKAVMHKLSKDFEVIHVHANNSGSGRFLGGVFVPNLLELSFVNKRYYQTENCRELFPGDLDSPNLPHLCDLWLGSFQWQR